MPNPQPTQVAEDNLGNLNHQPEAQGVEELIKGKRT